MTNFEIPIPLRTTDLTMADGAVIRIRQHGNADGPRLILAHGNGFAIDAYFPFWRCLMERFEIVLYDQRNHGHNPAMTSHITTSPISSKTWKLSSRVFSKRLAANRQAACFIRSRR